MHDTAQHAAALRVLTGDRRASLARLIQGLRRTIPNCFPNSGEQRMMLCMIVPQELTVAEQRVWDAFPTGQLEGFGAENVEQDAPAGGEGWDQDRQVRAQVLAALLCGAVGVEPGQVGQVYLDRVRVVGKLELQGATVKHGLRLHNCYIPEGIDLSEATTQTIELQGCHVGAIRLDRAKINGVFILSGAHLDGKDGPALTAENLTVTTSMICNKGFRAQGVGRRDAGTVDLNGASIGGFLAFRGADLDGRGGSALTAQSLTVTTSMICDKGFHARGLVDLHAASIGSQLAFRGAHLDGMSGPALLAQGLAVAADMFCDEGFRADGLVYLNGARIGGQLTFEDAHLDGKDDCALAADNLTVDQDMVCDRLTVDGKVVLGGHIGGLLSFEGAALNNRGGCALESDGLRVDKVMFCRNGFAAQGEIRLPAARIGGRLYFDGARLSNPGGRALVASRLTVDQDMFCRKEGPAGDEQPFRVEGGIVLRDAHIGGNFDLAGAVLTNRGGYALDADGLIVEQDLRCTDGFSAVGAVNLRGARAGKLLTFADATLSNPASDPDHWTLTLQEVETPVLVLKPRTSPDGHVDLTHARVRVLVDTQATWPMSLGLWGFVYDELYENPAIDVAARLAWLARDPRGYAPQPYEQLATVYRAAGRNEDARRVGIAKQRLRRRTLARPGQMWSVLLDLLVGYGYRTWLAGLWLLAWWIVGTLVFAASYPHHMTLATPGAPHPAFQPVVYALDVLLPVVNLHQQDTWIPGGAARWFAWAAILAGWVLTTAVLAALSGILKRD